MIENLTIKVCVDGKEVNIEEIIKATAEVDEKIKGAIEEAKEYIRQRAIRYYNYRFGLADEDEMITAYEKLCKKTKDEMVYERVLNMLNQEWNHTNSIYIKLLISTVIYKEK